MSSVLEDLHLMRGRLANFGTYQVATLLELNLLSQETRNIILTVVPNRTYFPVILIYKEDMSKVIELLEVICE